MEVNNCTNKNEAQILADKLGELNLQYRDRIPDNLIEYAKVHNLVIVTGASDDLIEFEGAIYDEGSCFDGGRIYFDQKHIAQSDDEQLQYHIDAIWCPRDDKDKIIASWKYEAKFPLYEFNVMEDGEIYCIGAVFSFDEIK